MTLRLERISFTYPTGTAPVLQEVSLDVPAGQVTGLVAPSGKGKSTLLKIAALALVPNRGAVHLAGHPVRATGFQVAPALRRRLALVLQSPRTATSERLSLRHIIAEPLSFRSGRRRPGPGEHRERIAELADLVQLTDDLLDRLPHQVSDGQLQRACLARALALDPEVLLCDEPTAMLDAPTTAVIMKIISDRARTGTAVLMASHDRPLLDAVGARIAHLDRSSSWPRRRDTTDRRHSSSQPASQTPTPPSSPNPLAAAPTLPPSTGSV